MIDLKINETVWVEFESSCRKLNVSIDEAIEEKASELSLRHFLLCIPNRRLKSEQIVSYLVEILGELPSPELVDRVGQVVRGPRITHDEYLSLERLQHGRCALCGTLLLGAASAHVDHKVPVALRGKSAIDNYQLLCAECNLGKSKMPGWILAAPFIREGSSPRMKYCVLSRFKGQCSEDSCESSAKLTELHIIPRVPISRGGRFIFDNLQALCAEHAQDRREAWLKEATKKAETTSTALKWKHHTWA